MAVIAVSSSRQGTTPFSLVPEGHSLNIIGSREIDGITDAADKKCRGNRQFDRNLPIAIGVSARLVRARELP
jgi:hypothetical protein